MIGALIPIHCFLGCVVVAGIAGAITAEKKILFVQSVPALIGIALILLK